VTSPQQHLLLSHVISDRECPLLSQSEAKGMDLDIPLNIPFSTTTYT